MQVREGWILRLAGLMVLFQIYKRKYLIFNNTLATTTMPGLDINWFRKDKGFDPDIIKKSLERRFRKP